MHSSAEFTTHTNDMMMFDLSNNTWGKVILNSDIIPAARFGQVTHTRGLCISYTIHCIIYICIFLKKYYY